MYASFRSIGAYVPENILTNADLEEMVDTSDEWILQRTGISERRIAGEDEMMAELSVAFLIKDLLDFCPLFAIEYSDCAAFFSWLL